QAPRRGPPSGEKEAGDLGWARHVAHVRPSWQPEMPASRQGALPLVHGEAVVPRWRVDGTAAGSVLGPAAHPHLSSRDRGGTAIARPLVSAGPVRPDTTTVVGPGARPQTGRLP